MDKTIGVCGFVATGSSSVSDFLKEFDENQVFDDFEFKLLTIPDGIEDLAYHLHEGGSKALSAIIAIERFKDLCSGKFMENLERAANRKFKLLTDAYLKGIIQTEWYGGRDTYSYRIFHSHSILYKPYRSFLYRLIKLVTILENSLKTRVKIFPMQKLSFSSFPEGFNDITGDYINNILISMGKKPGKNLVLDQVFTAKNPQKSFRFFSNPKAIVVDRDPRDHYLFGKYFLRSKVREHFPTHDVKDYVNFYRSVRRNGTWLQPDKNVLLLQFEDMIYEYEQTTKKITDFLELKEHSRPKSIFEPSLSINNTQLITVFPECVKDIIYIEKELPEYLYPFENYKGVKTRNGEMFWGKSPLNKG
jgi:hypothetical protein